MKVEMYRQIFEKYSIIKFYANPFSGTRVVPCGRTDGRTDGWMDGQTDMTNLTVVFANFASAPKKKHLLCSS
jgi:hypothetical protein